MPGRRTLSTRMARTTVALVAVLAPVSLPCLAPRAAQADDVPPVVALPSPADPGSSSARRPFPTRGEVASGVRHAPARPGGTGSSGWWLGTGAAALALAVCGWASVAAKRYRPGGMAGAVGLRVVGRTSLSPRHTVYLLQAGDRVLIVGTGPQGPPSLLGEMPGDPALASPGFDDDPGASRRLDLRLGDDT